MSNPSKAYQAAAKEIYNSDPSEAVTLEIISRHMEPNRKAAEERLEMLRMLEAHLGWGDCSLTSLHERARVLIDAALEGKR